MEEGREAKIARFYELVEKSAQLPKPKHALFGSKCPKCGAKLKRESVTDAIYTGENCTEFAKKVATKENLGLGIYTLAITRFTCECGYEFAEAAVSKMED